MLLGEARKDRFGIVGEVVYTDIEFENSTPGRFFSHVNSRSKTLMLSAALFYRLAEKQRAFFDVVGGGALLVPDSSLTLTQGLLRQRRISHKEDWVDPILGFKGLQPLGNSKFFISGAFLIGGFGVGSDFMWDANVNFGYQWTDSIATTIGYRYLDVDYRTAASSMTWPSKARCLAFPGGFKRQNS